MDLFVNHMGDMASLIGSLTVVGGALMWIYHKLISSPREKWKEREEKKRQRELIKTINEENKPLLNSINQLTEWLNESKKEREKLNELAVRNTKIIDEHGKKIENHDDRLIVLESKTGLRYKKGSD